MDTLLEEQKLQKELVFVRDEAPGILRQQKGKGFVYLDQNGNRVTDKETLLRIKDLVIPPQWNSVWISSVSNGYLQATGRDVKNRKQYIYHPRFVEHRQNYKFNKMGEFAQQLPQVREEISRLLRQKNWGREKVLALVVALLDDAGIRIGNEVYKQQNGSFGLTTLRRKHVTLEGDNLWLQFTGKSQKQHRIQVGDRRLMKLVKQCSELPGHEIFCYQDTEGKRRIVDSNDVNDFIRQLAGEGFSSKDFRTWNATSMTVYYYDETVREIEAHPRRSFEAALVKKVAHEIGNTPAVCRSYYIHPNILEAAVSHQIPPFQALPEEDNFFYSNDLRSWEKVTLGLITDPPINGAASSMQG